MRKVIRRSSGWIHAVLVMALLIPFLCALGTKRDELTGTGLYLKCLVIAFPIILTDLAIDKCRHMISYLMICIMTFGATAALGWGIALSFDRIFFRWGYFVILLIETFLVICDRLAGRLHKKEKKEITIGEVDPYWQPAHDILKEPSFAMLIYFGVIYFAALNVNSPAVCNAALASAVIYALVTFLHQYVVKTENYLLLNKRTCNLPSKRIYGIGGGMLALFLMILLVMTLPALFTARYRQYRDLREWKPKIEIQPEVEQPPDNQTVVTGEDPMAALIEQYGDPKDPPQWLTALGYAVEAAVILGILYAVFKKIRATFQDFRETNDENGDIVEELKETDSGQKIRKTVNRRGMTERERIRRQYRKVIRRNRKDRPAVHETPTEIETYAGIAGSEEGKKLHRQYEWARYS